MLTQTLASQVLSAALCCCQHHFLFWNGRLWGRSEPSSYHWSLKWSRTHHSGSYPCPRSHNSWRRAPCSSPHRAPWAWWWGTARSRRWASLHCTSPAQTSRRHRADQRRRWWSPGPGRLAEPRGSSGCNDPAAESRGIQHLKWQRGGYLSIFNTKRAQEGEAAFPVIRKRNKG